MGKYLLALSLSFLICHTAYSQYADQGAGTLKNQIWWLDWSGFTIADGATKTIQTNNGLTIQVAFSDVTSNHLFPSVMNTWSGAILHLLYDFSDPSLKPALYDGSTSLGSHFKMKVTVSRGGSPIGFSLVAVDAEASDLNERTTLQTDAGNWSTIEFFRNSGQSSDPVLGCGTQSAIITDTYGYASQTGQNPVIASQKAAPGPLTVDITTDHGASTGGMGLAFGILESVDRGDLPPSYGVAQHELLYTTANSCNYLAPLPTTTQLQDLKIGNIPADADPAQTTDDNTVGADEDGVSSFAAYDNNGVYIVDLTVGNTTGSDAYLTGWFDSNRNGQFDAGESVTVVVPNNATTATLTWTGLPTFLRPGTAAGYGFRFRLSSNQQESQAPTGNARDGEVEDYFVPSSTLCNITVTAKPDTLVCPGSIITARASGGTQYTWTGGAGISNPSIATPVITPASPATYTVTGSNPQGCEASASIQVTFYPLPAVTISDDTTICEGKSITLTASGGSPITWTSSGGLTPTISPSITVSPAASTTYYVNVTDGNGCSGTDSTTIVLHVLPTFALKPSMPVVCKNDTILLTASGGDIYTWSSIIGPIQANDPFLRISPSANADVSVRITDTICQISNTLTAHVAVLPLPETAVTTSNDIDCRIGQATLHVTGGIRYQWDVFPGISDPLASDPVVHPIVPTWYRVTVYSANGCHARDSVMVNTDYTSELSKYPVPSAFTPNNDGNNDCFGIKYWGPLLSLEMEVFNRWGQQVFISRTSGDCWDGNYKGTPQPSGTYIYQIRATTPCGIGYRKGTVLLIR